MTFSATERITNSILDRFLACPTADYTVTLAGFGGTKNKTVTVKASDAWTAFRIAQQQTSFTAIESITRADGLDCTGMVR